MIKRDKLKIDEDGVFREWPFLEKDLSDLRNESRIQLQSIIATRLNTRRAIREIVSPQLLKLQEDIENIHNQLNEIKELLEGPPGMRDDHKLPIKQS